MEGEFKVTLGAETIDCAPLTLGQVKRIALAIANYGAPTTEAGFDAELEIIQAGLSAARPALTREALLALPIGRRAMTVAVNQILVAAEFIKASPEAFAGEAAAGAS